MCVNGYDKSGLQNWTIGLLTKISLPLVITFNLISKLFKKLCGQRFQDVTFEN